MADKFKFELVSPERLLVSDEVEEVQVPGAEGEMTILAGHQPILATLKPGLLDIAYGGGKEARYFVRGGFAEVNAAGLTLLAETAIDLETMEAGVIAQAIKDAEEDVADATDGEKRDTAQIQLEHLRQVQAALNL
ncbi:F0F1 ATP synthase subunit epsilon [Methyloligella sp. 2.7D]|uniref:F0F1 ATP synthase subunit epsilon n=1 Tax=unclassified Methyloligella TaxID=2625955 RepID=UPI00157D44A6|nr:F0F1 ATP synthase subunit epsilon [Methyloligella sp. GL2]QKP76368.1 F0F1 ATP synthase subunit epsilon [Methyloligella sp. GL2]